MPVENFLTQVRDGSENELEYELLAKWPSIFCSGFLQYFSLHGYKTGILSFIILGNILK